MEPLSDVPEKSSGSWLDAVVWLGASFILPFYSFKFYRSALILSFKNVLAFLLALCVLIAWLQVGIFQVELLDFRFQIYQAYRTGNIPEVSVIDGEIALDNDQQVVILDRDGMYAVIDPDGEPEDIDLEKYQTILLINDEVYYIRDSHLGKNSSHSTSLGTLDSPSLDYRETFDDDFVIDRRVITKVISRHSLLYGIVDSIIQPIPIYFTRAFLITCLALLVWGIFRIFTIDITPHMVITTGIYSYLPALILDYLMYINYLWIPFVQQIIHLILWSILLIKLLKTKRENTPLSDFRLKTVLFGVPTALLLALNVIFEWDFLAPFIAAVTLLTIGVLFFVEHQAQKHQSVENPAP